MKKDSQKQIEIINYSRQNSNPKISVIVYVENNQQTLPWCLDSLAMQTIQDIEIICINNGSNDKSFEILQEYSIRDERFVIFSQHKTSKKLTYNFALSNAIGNYVVFCNPCGIYEDNYLEGLYNTIKKDASQFVCCNISRDYVIKNLVCDNLSNKIFDMSLIKQYGLLFLSDLNFMETFLIPYLCICDKLSKTGIKKQKDYKFEIPMEDSEKLISSYILTIEKIITLGFLNYNNQIWILDYIHNRLKENLKINITKKKEVIKLLKLIKKDILKYFPKSLIKGYELFNQIRKGKFVQTYYALVGITYKSYCGIYSIQMQNRKITHRFLGIEIYKKSYSNCMIKKYYLGIKFKEKYDLNVLNNKLDYLANRLTCSVAHLINCYSIHQKTFAGYKNLYKEKRVVLVGGGPTVNNFPKMDDVIYVGVNRAFLRNDLTFDYIFCVDKIGIEKFADELEEYSKKCKLFVGDINAGIDYQIPETIANRFNNCSRYKTDIGLIKTTYRFALNIESEPLGAFHSVVFQAIQFIMYTNPKEVYLVGIDCGNSGKHFTGVEHNCADRGEDIEKLEQVQISEWKRFKEFVKIYYPGTKIISVNPVNLKGVFEDVYTQSYLNEHPEINAEEELILEEV